MGYGVNYGGKGSLTMAGENLSEQNWPHAGKCGYGGRGPGDRPHPPHNYYSINNSTGRGRTQFSMSRAGDWLCTYCGDYQFGKNRYCRICYMQKPVRYVLQGSFSQEVVIIMVEVAHILRLLTLSVTRKVLLVVDLLSCGGPTTWTILNTIPPSLWPLLENDQKNVDPQNAEAEMYAQNRNHQNFMANNGGKGGVHSAQMAGSMLNNGSCGPGSGANGFGCSSGGGGPSNGSFLGMGPGGVRAPDQGGTTSSIIPQMGGPRPADFTSTMLASAKSFVPLLVGGGAPASKSNGAGSGLGPGGGTGRQRGRAPKKKGGTATPGAPLGGLMLDQCGGDLFRRKVGI